MIIDLILPKKCIICNSQIKSNNYPSWLCKNCFSKIYFINNINCERCGSPLDNRCLCNLLNEEISQVRSLFLYDEAGKELIHKWKYNGIFYIKDLFEKYILKKQELFRNYDGIIAVPIFWIKKIFRGFNQSYEIVRIIKNAFKIKDFSNSIIRKKFSKSQISFKNYYERKRNVNNVFKITKKIECEKILIVDDIITSCATVNEIASTLRKSNFNGKIDVFTLGLAV